VTDLLNLDTQLKLEVVTPNKKDIVQCVSNHGREEGKKLSGTFTEATSFAELIVLATLWDGTPNALKWMTQRI
jgi:hypothetical protein